jgi:alpha-galactosidase
MSIRYLEQRQEFHLMMKSSCYVMRVYQGYLCHLHWGGQLNGKSSNDDRAFSGLETVGGDLLRIVPRPSFSATPDPKQFLSLDTLPLEYPTFGTSDTRSPALHVLYADGSSASELIYQDYRIFQGKDSIPGLPSTYCEDQDNMETLEIDLRDPVSNLAVTLVYSVFEDWMR